MILSDILESAKKQGFRVH